MPPHGCGAAGVRLRHVSLVGRDWPARSPCSTRWRPPGTSSVRKPGRLRRRN